MAVTITKSYTFERGNYNDISDTAKVFAQDLWDTTGTNDRIHMLESIGFDTDIARSVAVHMEMCDRDTSYDSYNYGVFCGMGFMTTDTVIKFVLLHISFGYADHVKRER